MAVRSVSISASFSMMTSRKGGIDAFGRAGEDHGLILPVQNAKNVQCLLQDDGESCCVCRKIRSPHHTRSAKGVYKFWQEGLRSRLSALTLLDRTAGYLQIN